MPHKMVHGFIYKSCNFKYFFSALIMTEEQVENLSINEEDDVVDPWNVAGKSQTGIDYDKLISKSYMINNILHLMYME